MNIYLGYVEGINRIDTPYFTRPQNQFDWFNTNALVQTIQTSFYPPHYTNKVRISSDDADFNSEINYLWFEFKNKVYYYFIDDIEYINEDLMELSITMDYIQTYMFNIHTNNAIIERKFIDRWKRMTPTRWEINRDYIRENVSQGLYEKGVKQELRNMDNMVLVLKCTGKLGVEITSTGAPELSTLKGNKGCTLIETNQQNVMVPYRFYFSFPSFVTQFKISDSTSTRFYNNSPKYLMDFLSEEVIVDAFYIPIEYFSDYFELEGSVLTLKDYDGYLPHFARLTLMTTPTYNVVEYGTNVIEGQTYLTYNVIPFKRFTESISYADYFERNTAKGIEFISDYMPVLLDENYIYDKFGDDSTNVDFPTHYIKRLDYELSYTYDIGCSGSTVFYSHSSGNGISNADTIVVDTNVISSDLINSPWKEYVANNKNRWTSAGLQAGLGLASSFVDVVADYAISSRRIRRVMRDNRSKTKYKEKTGSKAQARKGELLDSLYGDIVDDISGGAASAISPLVSQAIADKNKQQAPASVKQLNAITSYCTYDKIIYYQIYKVRDYEQCAHFFHRNGYLVNEYVTDIDNIFGYVENRYYFNVLKCSDILITLEYCISDDATINGIAERLNDGIRLWSVEKHDVAIGEFTYDNIELSYLQ